MRLGDPCHFPGRKEERRKKKEVLFYFYYTKIGHYITSTTIIEVKFLTIVLVMYNVLYKFV